jgi:restriction endonuclease
MNLKGDPNRMYLRESRARRAYTCFNCSSLIQQGAYYYRDDNLFDRFKRGAAARQYCVRCILGVDSVEGDVASNLPSEDPYQLILPFGKQAIICRTQIQLVNVTDELVQLLSGNYDEIYNLSAESFENLVHGRISAMGYEAERVGHAFARDGGIDIVFWPRRPCTFPFLGAVQVKHHRARHRKTGPDAVRELAGVISTVPFQIGMVVTNTSFTADARWYAANQPAIIRLRDMEDLKRWIDSNFTDEAEWRDMPTAIELCPGVTIDLSNKRCHGNVGVKIGDERELKSDPLNHRH